MIKRLRCFFRNYHVIVEETVEVPTPWSSAYVYHAEIVHQRRCTDCGWTERVKP